MPEHPYTDAVLSTLEVVAAQRPDSLPALVEMMRQGPAQVAIAQLVTDWQAGNAGELAEIAIKASADLDRLERRRAIPWNRLGKIIDAPNVAAIYDMACQRAHRSPLIRKMRRLEILSQQLGRLLVNTQRQRQVERFLREPAKPVDSGWLADFLRRPRITPQGRAHP